VSASITTRSSLSKNGPDPLGLERHPDDVPGAVGVQKVEGLAPGGRIFPTPVGVEPGFVRPAWDRDSSDLGVSVDWRVT